MDQIRLAELSIRLGTRGADELVNKAMQELAVQLAKVHKAFCRARLGEVHIAACKIKSVASHIGLKSFGRVAGDVAALSLSGDSAALAACAARLARIGELSLVAVWELQDMSV
ncbi:MAG: hypothetical protein ACC646_08365 [Paracoccaceae bacterium]